MEDREMQPRPLKFTIKLKGDKSVDNSFVADDQLSSEHKTKASNRVDLFSNLVTNSQDQVNQSPAGGSEYCSTEEEENPTDNSEYQLVPYDSTVNSAGETNSVQDSVVYRPPPLSRPHPFSNQTPRVLPSIGAFTVQCANCFKWRLIPTKEKYEEIREHIMERPFFCETGREWRPEISCDDPPDITQDGSRLWAIDKPSIAQPPPGWERLLRIRSEGSCKFADVYYVSPTGKRFRSMVEIQRYLDKHPEHVEEGISLSKFSFQIPRPLQDDYVKKRPALAPAHPTPLNYGGEDRIPVPFDPPEVKPISWVCPDVDTDLQLSGPGSSTNVSYSLTPGTRYERKKKAPPKRRRIGDFIHNQNGINMQRSGQH